MVVGLNRWADGEAGPLTAGAAFHQPDPGAEADQIAGLTQWRDSRDASAVAVTLHDLRAALEAGHNIMPRPLLRPKPG